MTTMRADERSRAVAKAIERTMVSAFRAGSSEVIALFNACRTSLMAEGLEDAERAEVARRIAEAKVSVLFEREGAAAEFLESWGELEALGYASLEREASMLVYFLKFIDRVHGADGQEKRGVLDRLDKLIGVMAESGNDALAEHYRTVHYRLSGP